MFPVLAFFLAAASGAGAPPVQAVPALDLSRYAGKWYEIARYPNWFQRDCAGDVTATYTLRPGGKVGVLNECRAADGKTKSAKGSARLAGGKEPASKLKVSFFWPFSANYWVIALDPDYRWAVVGEPGRDYLWILSRQPTLDEAVYQQILDRIRQQGYDLSRLQRTRQGS